MQPSSARAQLRAIEQACLVRSMCCSQLQQVYERPGSPGCDTISNVEQAEHILQAPQ
jgi:hypothetical protein